MDKVNFNFCIARPWHPEDPNSSLCVYTIHNRSTFDGTIDDALEYKKYVEERENEEYFIYKIEKIELLKPKLYTRKNIK